ncbi:membrane protein [gut metagenome]|uniref:Membrane protein n=1 Tax=gut metagenome TaxID=749906 RepID=J9GI15_9ZZZZ
MFLLVRIHITHGNRIVEFRIANGQEVIFVAVLIIQNELIRFVTSHYINVMTTKSLVVAQNLIGSQRFHTSIIFISTAVYILRISVQLVHMIVALLVHQIVAQVGCSFQAIPNINRNRTTTIEVIIQSLMNVQIRICSNVLIAETSHTLTVGTITEVEDNITIFIILLYTVFVVCINRINRSNLLREHKGVRIVAQAGTSSLTGIFFTTSIRDIST